MALECFRTAAFATSLFELHFARDVLHDRALECRALDRIGRIKTLVGFSGLHEHTTQLQIATENNDRAGQRLAWSGIGFSKRWNDAEECVKIHERELNLAKDIGDRAAEAEACGSLGLALLDVGRLQEAIDRLSKKLAITQEMGIKAEEGRALESARIALARRQAQQGRGQQLVAVARVAEGQPAAMTQQLAAEKAKRCGARHKPGRPWEPPKQQRRPARRGWTREARQGPQDRGRRQ